VYKCGIAIATNLTTTTTTTTTTNQNNSSPRISFFFLSLAKVNFRGYSQLLSLTFSFAGAILSFPISIDLLCTHEFIYVFELWLVHWMVVCTCIHALVSASERARDGLYTLCVLVVTHSPIRAGDHCWAQESILWIFYCHMYSRPYNHPFIAHHAT